ncbi:MAG: hypothetical protein QQN41_09775 [Nitrosopumilus sp.]
MEYIVESLIYIIAIITLMILFFILHAIRIRNSAIADFNKRHEGELEYPRHGSRGSPRTTIRVPDNPPPRNKV